MIGKQIGPYEVTGSLGRGGMGEVYRARDTRLGRDVALKILPPEFARDEERLARFEREARMLAALQHQNIAAIYGLEELDGHPVLVMELAEGEDLAVRLGGGALPADEVEKIARQLAAGLEYAHEQGVVHRDLKPGNIKVAPGGRVKILDFGLARAFEGPLGSSSTGTAAADETVTRTRDLTGTGTVLGTAAYMSPEQTRGYTVDRRADIWAYGVIVFEMLTGQRLFAGETASDTLAAVLRKDPDWDLMPVDASPVLVQICRRCLERDPQLRLRDIGEARIALEGSSSSIMSMKTEILKAPAALAARRTSRAPLAVAAVAVLAALVVGWLGLAGRLGPVPVPQPLVRSTVMLKGGQGLYLNPAEPGPPVLSPDGRRLAFVLQDTSGQVALGVRPLDSDEVTVIPGTGGAGYPFWSPDSRRVGFFGAGHLNTVDVAGGGPVVPVCNASNGKGGSWGADDRILFTPAHNTPIMMVAAGGGEPVPVTSPDKDPDFRSHRFPRWLPDGKHFLYLAWHRSAGVRANTTDATLRVGSVDGDLDKELMPVQTDVRYAEGHIFYVHENNLMYRPFDAAKLDFTGPPQPLVGGVLSLGAAHCGVFTMADDGRACFVAAGGFMGAAKLVWAEDQNRELVVDKVGSLAGIEISPDGRRIAMSRIDEKQGAFDVWIHDLDRGLATRLTFAPESELSPVWSADSRTLYYIAELNGRNTITRQVADGSGRPESVVDTVGDPEISDVSPDGGTIAYTLTDSTGHGSVWLADADVGNPRLYRDVPYSMGEAHFSPDGRWMAYVSDETGQPEAFIESLNPDGGRWRISSNVGHDPNWSPKGDRLYYLDGTGALQATDIVETADGLAVGRTHTVATGVVTGPYPTFSVDQADGRVLLEVPVQEDLNNRIELISDWRQLLARGGD